MFLGLSISRVDDPCVENEDCASACKGFKLTYKHTEDFCVNNKCMCVGVVFYRSNNSTEITK